MAEHKSEKKGKQKKKVVQYDVRKNHETKRRILALVSAKEMYQMRALSGMPTGIPLPNPKFYLGTQTPALRVYSDWTALTTSGAGLLNTVINIIPSSCTTWTQLSTVFDEYLPLGGGVEVIGAQGVNAANSIGIYSFVVDFDNNAASTTSASSLNYDLKKMTSVYASAVKPVKLAFKFNRAPDMQWGNTVSSTAACWIKFYGSAATNMPLTQTVGLAYFYLDVVFRQA